MGFKALGHLSMRSGDVRSDAFLGSSAAAMVLGPNVGRGIRAACAVFNRSCGAFALATLPLVLGGYVAHTG